MYTWILFDLIQIFVSKICGTSKNANEIKQKSNKFILIIKWPKGTFIGHKRHILKTIKRYQLCAYLLRGHILIDQNYDYDVEINKFIYMSKLCSLLKIYYFACLNVHTYINIYTKSFICF